MSQSNPLPPRNLLSYFHVSVSKYHLLALGILAVISGDFYSWNVGLNAGIGSYAISMTLMGSAYGFFCCCASELSSAIPFAGGSYGLARSTLGYYLGFISGCVEVTYYIFLSSFIISAITDFIVSANHSYAGYEPLISALLFISQICTISINNNFFWWTVLIFTIFSLLILTIYNVGLLGNVDFNKFSLWRDSHGDMEGDGIFIGGVTQFITSLPYSIYFYIGAELLNLTCDDVRNPRRDVPFGQIGTAITMFIHSVFVLFVACSVHPGINHIQKELAPLAHGFAIIFNTTTQQGTLLSIIPAYGSALACAYGYTKLLFAMSTSKIFPDILLVRTKSSGTPINALIFGSIVGYALQLLMHYYMENDFVFFNMTLLLAFLMYIPQCVGFIVLRQKLSSLPREFRSPVGISGAIFAIFMFICGSISCIAFQNDDYLTIFSFMGYVAVLSLYYIVYCRHRQVFSAAEKEVMFVAHVAICKLPC